MNPRNFIIICVISLTPLCNAQQEVLYTQYIFSQLAINPAYAGNNDNMSLLALARKQWIGLEGSPTNFSFLGHTSFSPHNTEYLKYSENTRRRLLPKNNKQIGLGLILFNDKIGVNNTFLTSLAYSYKIRFSSNKRLSFGLQTTFLKFNQFFSELENLNPNDPVFQENVQVTRFNVGTGICYESDQYFIGISVPELIENNLDPNNDTGESQLRQYFFSAGYLFYLNHKFKFKPSVMVRHTESMPTQFDINGNFLYRDKIWAGLSYRYMNSINFSFQLNLTDELRMGLAYDYIISKIRKANYGSVEFMINFIFKQPKHRVINPRYF